jgi:hypothetical protein
MENYAKPPPDTSLSSRSMTTSDKLLLKFAALQIGLFAAGCGIVKLQDHFNPNSQIATHSHILSWGPGSKSVEIYSKEQVLELAGVIN